MDAIFGMAFIDLDPALAKCVAPRYIRMRRIALRTRALSTTGNGLRAATGLFPGGAQVKRRGTASRGWAANRRVAAALPLAATPPRQGHRHVARHGPLRSGRRTRTHLLLLLQDRLGNSPDSDPRKPSPSLVELDDRTAGRPTIRLAFPRPRRYILLAQPRARRWSCAQRSSSPSPSFPQPPWPNPIPAPSSNRPSPLTAAARSSRACAPTR